MLHDARLWSRICNTQHRQGLSSVRLVRPPKRLIDVGSESNSNIKPRLHIPPDSATSEYLALGHACGKLAQTRPTQISLSNIIVHGIPFDQVSKTTRIIQLLSRARVPLPLGRLSVHRARLCRGLERTFIIDERYIHPCCTYYPCYSKL